MGLMKFDINRYTKRRFHKDDNIDNKIKALFLLLDYEITRRKLISTRQLTIIDIWIQKFETHEMYEVIPMFKLRRGAIVRQIIVDNNEDMTFKKWINSIYNKVINFFKSLFKKK
jgi:hypothetical protein